MVSVASLLGRADRRPVLDAVRKAERPIASFVPYAAQVAPDAVMTYGGDVLRTWRLDGIPAEMADTGLLDHRALTLNALWCSIAHASVALYLHTVRRRVPFEGRGGEFDTVFAVKHDRAYRAALAARGAMTTEHYVTLLHRAPPGQKAIRHTLRDAKAARTAALAQLDRVSSTLDAGLSPYGARRLANYTEDGVEYTESVRFLDALASGRWLPRMRVARSPLDTVIGASRILAGLPTPDAIELRGTHGSRHARVVEFKDHALSASPDALDRLLYGPAEFVATRSFCFISPRTAERRLQFRANTLPSAGTGTADEMSDIQAAEQRIRNGEVAMGEYHFSLAVMADTARLAREHAEWCAREIEAAGFSAAFADTALEASWFAQLPGNTHLRPAPSMDTSEKLVATAPLHGFARGRATGNPWGPAVTTLETPGGQPLDFNFHVTDPASGDARNRRALGNAAAFGISGAGKTTVLGHMLTQSRRFALDAPLTQIVLDFRGGLRLCVLANGGVYRAFTPGTWTGCSPFQMPLTPINIALLEQLVAMCARREGEAYGLSVADEQRVSAALRAIENLDVEHRNFSTLVQNIGAEPGREDSLRARLSRWCSAGPGGRRGSLAWVFDDGPDEIDFETGGIYGIDPTPLFKMPTACDPLLFYVLHRLQGAMDGRRLQFMIDEVPQYLRNPVTARLVVDIATNARRENAMGVYAAQTYQQVSSNPAGDEMLANVATEIYLPNHGAPESMQEAAQLTDAEFGFIRHAPDQSRQFLVRQQVGERRISTRAALNLAGMEDSLAVLSANPGTNALADAVIADVGADPALWLPEFHRRRRAAAQ